MESGGPYLVLLCVITDPAELIFYDLSSLLIYSPFHLPNYRFRRLFLSTRDKLLQGLLVPGFDEGSCLSRYQAASCHKAILYHEALSSLLSQFTKLYNKTVKLLISILSSGPMVCQYIVWVLYGDLPNKMLTLASAFLYAPITN